MMPEMNTNEKWMATLILFAAEIIGIVIAGLIGGMQ
jgi:hypothetical protein